MRKFKIKNIPAEQGEYPKDRIDQARGRAGGVGFAYLIATLLLITAACFPLLESESAPLGVTRFWKMFTPESLKGIATGETLVPFINAVLYAAMLCVLAVSLIKSLACLFDLFRKKISKTYGFNRNLYAMQDMGSVFSSAFSAVTWVHFLIYMFSGAKVTALFPILLVGGILVHFVCGIKGGKASYFDVDEKGGVVEYKRLISRWIPFLRNVLQFVSTILMMFFFMRVCTIDDNLPFFVQRGVLLDYIRENPFSCASFYFQTLTLLALLVLLRHAMGIAEFDIEGTRALGMKTFRIFTFIVFLTAGMTFVWRYLIGEAVFYLDEGGIMLMRVETWTDSSSLILAAISLGMFVIEVVMRNLPKTPKTEAEESETRGDGSAFIAENEAESADELALAEESATASVATETEQTDETVLNDLPDKK